MLVADKWKDYELIDCGNGEKLERWGKFILRRPDPQAMWPVSKPELWKKADANYHRSKSGGGNWDYVKKLPNEWKISYGELLFNIKTMGFKHTGLFPEQAANWDWIIDKVKSAKKQPNVLNLFAYTGGATAAAAYGGAKVCHVDASKGMISQAKSNIEASRLGDRPVRYIVDDVVKFVQREKRRGNKYDGIMMDPPVYGHGPNGETWNIETDLYELITNCLEIMSDEPLFFIVNCYTVGISPVALQNLLTMTIGKRFKGKVTSQEIGLPVTASELVLPCGITGRWASEEN